MVLEFAPHRYVDVDKIVSLQWIEEKDGKQASGFVMIGMDKFFLFDKKLFDIIESAYIYQNKSFMCDDKNKKIRWVKGEK